MMKLVFSILLILVAAVSYCQEHTYIVMDYEGNLDKRQRTLNVRPEHVTRDEIGIFCGSDNDPVDFHVVSQKHYDILTKFICEYIVPDSPAYFDLHESLGYNYTIYITKGGETVCELQLFDKQVKKYFILLVDILNKEGMNTNLSDYINKEILHRN